MGLHPGMKDYDLYRPKTPEKPLEVPLRGHKRGQTADRTDRNLRGVPVIGHGSGAISGTTPGGEVRFAGRFEVEQRDLDEHTRLVIRERLKLARVTLRMGGMS